MIKTVYYRGHIDFCNYACSYCPFAKKEKDISKLKKDEHSLKKLYDFIKSKEIILELMINPYGEAFCEQIYQDYMSELASLQNVYKIGIQTNLSLDLDKFVQNMQKKQADMKKFMIWASFHNEFANMQEFVQKANKAYEFMNISVGIVANTKNYEQIKALRKLLNPKIYLWINALDRQKNRFKADIIEKLRAIDPMFEYEFCHYRDEQDGFEKCNSYKNIYIDKNNYSSNCFFKKKKAISKDCNEHSKCDCYLGYSNFDSKISNFFGRYKTFRIPYKRKFKAIFIDIDNVMTDENSNLKENLQDILKELKKSAKLYIATSRSLNSSKKKLKSDMQYFSGGVFSDGTLIIDFEKEYEYLQILDKDLENKVYEYIDKSLFEKSNIYFKKDIYGQKSVLRLKIPRNINKDIKIDDVEKRLYNNRCYIQSKGVSKLSGICNLMQINSYEKEDILFISDNPQDKDVFENLIYTVYPAKKEEIKKISYYSMNLENISLIVR